MTDKTYVTDNVTNVTSQDGSDSEAFGRRLRSAVLSKGLKKNDLCEVVGIKRPTWANYWDGKRICDANKIFAIADQLAVSPRWLATGEGPRDTPDAISEENHGEWRLIGLYRSLGRSQQAHLVETAKMLWNGAVKDRRREVSDTVHDRPAGFSGFEGEGD